MRGMEEKRDYGSDHDLLIALDTKVTILISDIKQMNGNLRTKINNHETRIRTIEDEHLSIDPQKQVKRIESLEAKVGGFWRVVGIASGVGAVFGGVGFYLFDVFM